MVSLLHRKQTSQLKIVYVDLATPSLLVRRSWCVACTTTGAAAIAIAFTTLGPAAWLVVFVLRVLCPHNCYCSSVSSFGCPVHCFFRCFFFPCLLHYRVSLSQAALTLGHFGAFGGCFRQCYSVTGREGGREGGRAVGGSRTQCSVSQR